MAAFTAGWATWAIHHDAHPGPALILAAVTTVTVANLLTDIYHSNIYHSKH